MIINLKTGEKGYEYEKEKHIRMLKSMMQKGIKYPDVEGD